MSFWTDIIAYSPEWIDVYPERVRRFISALAGGSSEADAEAEIACYGVKDEDGKARAQAANPDIDTLIRRLIAQAAKAEELDCDATGVYEPPSWTELSDTHIGPFFSVEGSVSKVCQTLAAAPKVPFAEFEVVGLRPGREIVECLSLSGEEAYLDVSELNLEVGPNVALYPDRDPEFIGWLRVLLSGEGQPHPLTREQLIDRARNCTAFRRIVQYAGQCFGVNEWRWAVSCRG